ncbi:putative RNA-directed DNA polymerase, eukaryota, reverse transcriptase zinc-binding domain protein [Tanacetum coccineum]
MALQSTTATSLRGSINDPDNKAELGPLTTSKAAAKIGYVKELTTLERNKVMDLRQKAKVGWTFHGDENSSFFHGMLNAKSNRSRINGLNILGTWTTNPVSIKNHILRCYELKFKEANLNRPTFSSNMFKQITPDDSQLLDHSFTPLKIKKAVWDCNGDKAPGPDGFTFKFIKKNWDVLKDDIISYVQEFENSAYIPRGCNSSFITLIHKIEDPLSIGDYRPISLIGCQYKIITKVLANRLALVISSVISKVKMAYIKGRQIIDGPLIVDEIISWVKKYKKRLMFLKLDFKKAFDTLNWSFLISIMEQMSFSPKWTKWISSCLNSTFASVLVNGSLTREFRMKIGLRQGDPLSPFLFIIAVEALNFTDDALIMREWSLLNAKNRSRILMCFHLASGLKVNFHKRKLFGVGVTNSEVNSLASTIGCLPSYFPCTYLGLPIGGNMARCANWSILVDKF